MNIFKLLTISLIILRQFKERREILKFYNI